MMLSLLPFSLLTLISASTIPQVDPQHVFGTPAHEADLHIPSIHESTVMARRILHLSTISNLVTSFPYTTHNDGEESIQEDRPSDVAGQPIGLMEYYADCEPSSGNPTLLAINIATPYRNYHDGSNISMSVRWWPKTTNYYVSSDDDIPTPHTPAALPRFSLQGRLEAISRTDLVKGLVPACFLKSHPDSILWQPGNDIHESQYMRLVVEHVYWFGGFGDRARIGWLPIEDWRNVTKEEIEACKLPGEEQQDRGVFSRWWRKDWL